MEEHSLTIVIPVYNERSTIKNAIQSLDEIRKGTDFDIEILLINDGSNDGTEEILAKISKEHFRVINHPINRGYGAAIKTGIKAAESSYVAITDADETYPNECIPIFFHKALNQNLDMIVGDRTNGNVRIPFIRRPAKWILNILANYLTGVKIPDLNSGLRIMKKEVVDLFKHILPDGFSFTTTITLAMLCNGYNIGFNPINYKKRKGRSKIRPINDTLNFLQLIIRTVLYFNPLRIFIPLSCVFFILSWLMVIYRLLIGKAFGVTSVILFISGMQLLAIGMLADLIDKRIK